MTIGSFLDEKREYPLSAVSVATAAAFAVLAKKNLRPRTILGDIRMRARLPRYGRKTRKAVIPFGYLGKELGLMPIAGIASAKLLMDGRKQGAIAIAAATLTSIAASHVFDRVLQQRTPPPGRKAPADPHFPSGHALHSTAVLGIGAWVLTREGIAGKKAAIAGAAALAAALGFDRLVQDRHWTTDVVGGWLAAISIASLAAAGYELSRPRRVRRRGSGRKRSETR
jgi:undecaprenyl-diphosphatase